MTIQGYDLVGDIHGHADALHRLLKTLEYEEVKGVFRHSERQMIFVGDFIDRGPQQREVLRIARSMCEDGTARAVMGNHEFNAIGWATPKEGSEGSFLRDHSPKNAHQHAEFLDQIEENSEAHKDAIKWFRTLPLWLDLDDGLRVVHACWHDPSLQALKPFLNDAGCLTGDGVLESYRDGSVAHSAVEILLKGPEERLPAGIRFREGGHWREEARLRWWDQNATTFRKAAIGMEGRENEIPATILPKDYRYHEGKPVFFGHYWLKDQPPKITAPNAACLDFSVANEGYLTAYRWSGERDLRKSNLVFVSA